MKIIIICKTTKIPKAKLGRMQMITKVQVRPKRVGLTAIQSASANQTIPKMHHPNTTAEAPTKSNRSH
jgi:hypothetical protein